MMLLGKKIINISEFQLLLVYTWNSIADIKNIYSEVFLNVGVSSPLSLVKVYLYVIKITFVRF